MQDSKILTGGVLAWVAFFLCICASGLSAEPTGEASITPSRECSDVRLIPKAHRPGWVATGTWLSSGELLLIDALSKDFLLFDDEAEFLGKQPEPVALAVKNEFVEFLPVVAHGTEEELWVQLVGTRMVRVNWGKVTAVRNLWGLPIRENAKLIAILNWTLSGSSEMFAYGNFEMDGDRKSVRTGFFRLNLDAPKTSAILRAMPEDHPVHIWYRLGNNYLASLNGADYGLWVDDKVQLLKYDADDDSLETLDIIPKQLTEPPTFPDFETTDDFGEVMAVVEDSTMPTGLYAWDGALYLVWRAPTAEGEQGWYLSKFAAESGHFQGTMTLPSEAHHLLVIPGPDSWALIEKGPVHGFGFQATGGVRYIPATEIKAFEPGGVICK